MSREEKKKKENLGRRADVDDAWHGSRDGFEMQKMDLTCERLQYSCYVESWLNHPLSDHEDFQDT
jgi:hypothetical protein